MLEYVDAQRALQTCNCPLKCIISFAARTVHHFLANSHNRGIVLYVSVQVGTGSEQQVEEIWDESKGKMRPRKRKKSGHRLNSDKTTPLSPTCSSATNDAYGIINKQDEKTSDRKEKWDWEGRYEALHIRLLTASEACRYVCNCCREALMWLAKENIWANIHMLDTCSIKYAIFVSVLLVRGWCM